MTNEEAIIKLKEAICYIEWHVSMRYVVAFEEAIEALKKQIPKKPHIYIAEDRVPSEQKIPVCSECLTELEKTIESWYCPHCGQAIDWSE